jgi:hypothetical protein
MQEDASSQGEQLSAHVPEWEANPPSGFTLSRRSLLIGGGALVAAGLLTGLSLNQQQLGYRGLAQTGNAATLENFTDFSALVTGFDTSELDGPTAQALYTAYLQTPPVGASPAAASAATGGTSAANAASGSTGARNVVTSTTEMTSTGAGGTVPGTVTGIVTGTVTGTTPTTSSEATSVAEAVTATMAVTSARTATGTAAGTAGGTPVAAAVAVSAPTVTSATLEDLLLKAGYLSNDPPQTLEDIERRGVFDEEPYASMANGVIEGWYSGLVQAPNGASQTVAWLPALGWKALAYTLAPGYCEGETGVWGDAPAGAPDAEAITA